MHHPTQPISLPEGEQHPTPPPKSISAASRPLHSAAGTLRKLATVVAPLALSPLSLTAFRDDEERRMAVLGDRKYCNVAGQGHNEQAHHSQQCLILIA